MAVDYDTGTLYIGKVTNVTRETGEASFAYKMDGNRYKEKENRERSIDSFHRSQVFSNKLNLDFKKNGIIVLQNQDELRKLLLSRKKK